MAECDRLQLGQPVAAAGAAAANWQLIVDERATTIGQDGWQADQARPVLFAAADREPSDAAVVCKHGSAGPRGHPGAASASGVGDGSGVREIGQRGGRGRKGVGGISQKGSSCGPQGCRAEQDDPLGTTGQAFRRIG